MVHFIVAREKLHSNLLGLHVQSGSWVTDGNLHGLTAGLSAKSSGIMTSTARAAEIIGSRLRLQAYSLTFIDAFHLIAWVCTGMLLVTAVLRKAPMNFGQISLLQQGSISNQRRIS
jgi:DHA2 family multidrug resistance protein